MADLGKRIAKIREDQKLTQNELAGALGVSQSTISQIESGDRKPSFNMLRRIAEKLSVSPAYVLGASVESLTPDEEVHFREYRGLTKKARQELSDFMKYLQSKQRKNSTPD